MSITSTTYARPPMPEVVLEPPDEVLPDEQELHRANLRRLSEAQHASREFSRLAAPLRERVTKQDTADDSTIVRLNVVLSSAPVDSKEYADALAQAQEIVNEGNEIERKLRLKSRAAGIIDQLVAINGGRFGEAQRAAEKSLLPCFALATKGLEAVREIFRLNPVVTAAVDAAVAKLDRLKWNPGVEDYSAAVAAVLSEVDAVAMKHATSKDVKAGWRNALHVVSPFPTEVIR